MNTIDILRTIVKNHAAQTLHFAPPVTPIAEGLDVAIEVYDTPDDEIQTAFAVDRLMVDMQTANVMVTVYDAIKPTSREIADKMMTSKLGFIRVSEIAWKAVK